MYRTSEEWLQIFKEQFPTVEEFTDAYSDVITRIPHVVPIHFPKYLDKVLIQDSCSYGFGMHYADSCLKVPDIKTPVNVLFFLTTESYGGRKLQGRLIWYTPVDINHARIVGALDKKLYELYAALDQSFQCKVPTPVFRLFQQQSKVPVQLAPTDVPNVAFTNHNGKLGIGTLLGCEITSKATAIPCPNGLTDYVIISQGFSSIAMPYNVQSVTMAFNEADVNTPVFVVVGTIMYCFARRDNYESEERIMIPVNQLSSMIATPSMPKFGIAPDPIILTPR